MVATKLNYTIKLIANDNSTNLTKIPMNLINDKFHETALNADLISKTHLQKSALQQELREYLIITSDSLKSSVDKFAHWKRMQGFPCKVMSQNIWTRNQVLDSIKSHALANPNLYYLVLAGGIDVIPEYYNGLDAWEGTKYEDYYVTDIGYSILDNDETPDLILSRLPFSDKTELENVLTKIINYQQSPPVSKEFYERGTHASYFQLKDKKNSDLTDDEKCREDRDFILASEKARDAMLEIGKKISRVYTARSYATPKEYKNKEPLPTEISYPNFNWNGSALDIINSINKGAYYILHRDHGGIDCWGDPYFSTTHINQLANSDLLPFVFSINCNTGHYDKKDCFGKSIMASKNGGSVGIICAGGQTPTSYNDKLTQTIFNYIRDNYELMPITMGEILQYGLNLICTSYNSELTKYQRKTYTIFGDPGQDFNMKAPIFPHNISVDLSNKWNVSCEADQVVIVIYDISQNKIYSYDTSTVSLIDFKGRDFSILIKGDGFRTFFCEISNDETIFINMPYTETNLNLQGRKIEIGNGLFNESIKKYLFTKGKYIFKGEVSIHPGVIFETDAELEIN